MPKFRFYEQFLKYPLLIRGGATLGLVIPLVILTYAQNNVGSIYKACDGNPRCNPPATPPLVLPNFLQPSTSEKGKVTQLITPRQKICFPLTGCEKIVSASISIKGTNPDSKQSEGFECRNSRVVIKFKSTPESNKEYEIVINMTGKTGKPEEVRGYFKVVVPEFQWSKDLQNSSAGELEKYQSELCNNQ